MSQVFHYTTKLEQEYSAKGTAVLEYKLRKVPGVVSACILKDNTLSVYAKDKLSLAKALFALRLVPVRD